MESLKMLTVQISKPIKVMPIQNLEPEHLVIIQREIRKNGGAIHNKREVEGLPLY